MGLKTKKSGVIIIGLLVGYILTTLYVGMVLKDPEYIDINIIGAKITLAYLQIIGLIIGFFLGVIVATFAGRKGFDKQEFLKRIQRETFSFIGLSFAFMTFIFTVAIPQAIPQAIGMHVTTQGDVFIPSTSSSLLMSIFLSITLMLLTLGFFFRVFGKQ